LSDPSHTHRRLNISDEVAYVLPMLVFLLLTGLPGMLPARWMAAAYPITYSVKTVVVAALLFALRQHYTPIRWNFWWMGILLGIVGIFQWVLMQNWLGNHFSWFALSHDAFDPTKAIASPRVRNAFIAVRMIGAVMVVPVMEELFWRDFLWRTILAPNDFKLASIGEFGWAPVLIVPIAFSSVHGNWFPTAIVWGVLIELLLVWSRSLGACILMHATTNLLLAIYVLQYHAWGFW
jgi:CAAX prenyl protease-like protein